MPPTIVRGSADVKGSCQTGLLLFDSLALSLAPFTPGLRRASCQIGLLLLCSIPNRQYDSVTKGGRDHHPTMPPTP